MSWRLHSRCRTEECGCRGNKEAKKAHAPLVAAAPRRGGAECGLLVVGTRG